MAHPDATETQRRSRMRTVLDADQTILKLDRTADRLNETLDGFGELLGELTVALGEFTTAVQGFASATGDLQVVVDKADALVGPLAATAQLGDQLRGVAGQMTGQLTGQAAAAMKKGVQAGKGLTGRA